MNIPIVVSAFGTTTEAHKTYAFFDELLKKRFPDHEILWAYSSRMVRDLVKKKQDIKLKSPAQVLADLEDKGHKWAIVQSLHLISGHEFYRLIEEIQGCRIRTSVGLPLLHDPEDYDAVIHELTPYLTNLEHEGVIFVGHGTDHPIWSSYVALHHLLRERFGSNIYVGVVEGKPSRDRIIDAVVQSGVEKVRLIPFMLVAGTHFREDLVGDEGSWKTALEEKGISVSAETNGLGLNKGIMEIFIQHIKMAMDVIPTC